MRVPSRDAAFWEELPRVWVEPEGVRSEGRFYDVEHARSYRDRLVIKLSGVDDAGAAKRLRGRRVLAAEEDAPNLEEGTHYAARLVGMEVRDEAGELLGRVRDVMPTGGVDLLVVAPEGKGKAEELLIPMAREIVLEVSEDQRRIRVRPPAGLVELNRP